MDDSEPYEVISPTKIRLSPLAKEMARMHGMSERELAKHLLQQTLRRADGDTQRQGEN